MNKNCTIKFSFSQEGSDVHLVTLIFYGIAIDFPIKDHLEEERVNSKGIDLLTEFIFLIIFARKTLMLVSWHIGLTMEA